MATTSRLLVTIVTICKNSGDWNFLNDQVLLLSKKHGQLKQATTRMVQVVMTFLDETPSMDVKLSVIETLRTVTEGKVGFFIGRRRCFLWMVVKAYYYRFSSKSSEPVLPVFFPTSRSLKVTFMRPRIFCASCRWRHLVP